MAVYRIEDLALESYPRFLMPTARSFFIPPDLQAAPFSWSQALQMP
jgi:hypothetical protein